MKKEVFSVLAPDTFEIAVKEPAERNMANGRVIELVARHLGVPRGKVRIVSGHRSPTKMLRIDA